jgi:hypothetical protein
MRCESQSAPCWPWLGSPERVAKDGEPSNQYVVSMPTVLRIGNYRFHFYSDERQEPAHVHVQTPDGECKF